MNAGNMGPAAYACSAAAYIRHNRAMGLRFRGVEQVLSALGRYLKAAGAPR